MRNKNKEVPECAIDVILIRLTVFDVAFLTQDSIEISILQSYHFFIETRTITLLQEKKI